MGTYPSFIVHIVAAVALYLVAWFGLRWARRKRPEPVAYWTERALPAVAVLLVALFRETFDAASIKSFFDALSWVVGAAASAYLAHRLRLG